MIPMVAVALVLATAGPAFARKPPKGGGGGGSSPTGYDVAYPQCGSALPSSPLFGIVGVNNGIVYSANPCLVAQYQWATTSTTTAGAKVSFYANTANPGTASTHWPSGQTINGRSCDGTLNAACSYGYGWNAAADSFTDAARAAGTTAAATSPWWLDVETANSWQSNTDLNNADIQGGLDYLASQRVPSAGIYTNRTSFQSIMGSTTSFATYPSWVPGATSLTGAQSNCSASITGGHVVYAQYPSGGFDGDYPCP